MKPPALVVRLASLLLCRKPSLCIYKLTAICSLCENIHAVLELLYRRVDDGASYENPGTILASPDSTGRVVVRWTCGKMQMHRVSASGPFDLTLAPSAAASSLSEPPSTAESTSQEAFWDAGSTQGGTIAPMGAVARCDHGSSGILARTGITSGVLQWSVTTSGHPHGDEAVCLGIAQGPLRNRRYDSNENSTILLRAFTGRLLVNGESTEPADGSDADKLEMHPGEVVTFTLHCGDNDDGVLSVRTPRGWFVLHKAVPSSGGKWYPAAFTYSRATITTTSMVASDSEDGIVTAENAKIG